MQVDKLLHFLAGWAIFASLMPHTGALEAFGAVVAVGAGKEVLWDWGSNWRAKRRGLLPVHEVSPEDFLATVLGAVSAELADLALVWLKNNI